MTCLVENPQGFQFKEPQDYSLAGSPFTPVTSQLQLFTLAHIHTLLVQQFAPAPKTGKKKSRRTAVCGSAAPSSTSTSAPQSNAPAATGSRSSFTAAAPIPPQPQIYTLAGGMWLAMSAFLAQIQTVQNYDSEGLIPLSASIQESAEDQANYWINILSGTSNSIPTPPSGVNPVGNPAYDPHLAPPGTYSDAQILDWDTKYLTGQPLANQISIDTADLNVHNTLYNQSSSFYSGMNSTTNQNSSDATQTIQIALQEYSQGPQSLLTKIAQLL